MTRGTRLAERLCLPACKRDNGCCTRRQPQHPRQRYNAGRPTQRPATSPPLELDSQSSGSIEKREQTDPRAGRTVTRDRLVGARARCGPSSSRGGVGEELQLARGARIAVRSRDAQ